MPLRDVIYTIESNFHLYPLSEVLEKSTSECDIGSIVIWQVEDLDDRILLYRTSPAGEAASLHSDARKIVFVDKASYEKNPRSALSDIDVFKNASQYQISGVRFGQKSDDKFYKPTEALVGILSISGDHNPADAVALSDLIAMIIWNHRSSRYLEAQHSVDRILSNSWNDEVEWVDLDDPLLEHTHSHNFSVFSLLGDQVRERHTTGNKLAQPSEFFESKIHESLEELLIGRWLRSEELDHKKLKGQSGEFYYYWMIVPISSNFYDLSAEDSPTVVDGIQHFAVLETVFLSDELTSRFLYTSADRRLVERCVSKYLNGVAADRIEEKADDITSLLTDSLPEDPRPNLMKVITATKKRIHGVQEVCIIEPEYFRIKDGASNHRTLSDLGTLDFDSSVIDSVLLWDENNESYLTNKHPKLVMYDDMYCLVRSVGNVLRKRFMLFMFKDSSVSYVSLEICKNIANKIELFWQSCDLEHERTSTLVQISHVVRGPVYSALEDIRVMQRGKNSTILKKFSIRGDRSDEDVIRDVAGSLARARSIADSAKYLLGQIKEENYQNRRVDFFNILNEVRACLENERSKLGITITIRDLVNRKNDSALRVMGDEDLLWLLIYNLMENALKYGYRRSEVRIDITNGGGKEIVFSISNKADLLWARDQERIFLPYQRAIGAYAVNGRPGTGLGLPAAHQIAKSFKPNFGIQFKQDDIRTKSLKSGEVTFYTRFIRDIDEQ